MYPVVIETKICSLDTIFFEQGIYPRMCTDKERIELFKDMFEQQDQRVDPIKVARRSDGMYVLIDGNHRFYGAKNAKKTEISVEILDLDGDNPNELLKWAGIYNCFHGMPLSFKERRSLVEKMYAHGSALKELHELLQIPIRTLAFWTEHIRVDEKIKKTTEIKDLNEQGVGQRTIAQKMGVSKTAIQKKLKTKDAGDIAFEKYKKGVAIENMLKTALEKKEAEEARVAAVVKENVRVLVESMASLDGLIFTRQGLPLREMVREELFINSAFSKSFRNIALRFMPPSDQMIADVAAYLTRVSEFAKEVVHPESAGDIDMLDPIWPLMDGIKKDIGKLEKIYSSSVLVENNQEDSTPDTRVKRLVDWYSDIWKGVPPEVQGGKKSGWGRIASIFQEMLSSCDQQGITGAEAHLKEVYTFYKDADAGTVDKEDKFFLKDKVKSLVMLQGKYANIVAIKNKGNGNGHGKIKDGNGDDVTVGTFGFPKHAIKN